LELKPPVDRESLALRMVGHLGYIAMELPGSACGTSFVDVSAILVAISFGSLAERPEEHVLGAIEVHYALCLVIDIPSGGGAEGGSLYRP
jgi:hypothetical protein